MCAPQTGFHYISNNLAVTECIPLYFCHRWKQDFVSKGMWHRYVFIPHVFQQVTFSLMFKVQSCHLLHVCVFQLLCHFDLEETKRHIKYRICHLFTPLLCQNVIYLLAQTHLRKTNKSLLFPYWYFDKTSIITLNFMCDFGYHSRTKIFLFFFSFSGHKRLQWMMNHCLKVRYI